MKTKFAFVAGALALGLAAPLTMGAGAAYAQCTNGERIDGSTADQARAKIQGAGYTNVAGLTKGCDNYWHGTANQGSRRVGVVLSPAGQVMVESALDQPPGMEGGTSYIVGTQPAPPSQPAVPTYAPSYPQTATTPPAGSYPVQPAYPQSIRPETQRAVPEYR